MKPFPSVLFLIGLTLSASAHINSFSYADINISSKEVYFDLKMTQRTTLELFNLDTDLDGAIQPEELDDAWEVLYYYLDNKIKVLSGNAALGMAGYQQLKPEIVKLSYFRDEYDAYLRVQFRYQRDDSEAALSIFNNLSEETDPFHRSLANLTTTAGKFRFVFSRFNYLEVRPDGSNNGFTPDDDSLLSQGPQLPGAPEVIRSVTGAMVDSPVTPILDGWSREPQLSDSAALEPSK